MSEKAEAIRRWFLDWIKSSGVRKEDRKLSECD